MPRLPDTFAFWGCLGFEERSVSVLRSIISGGQCPTQKRIFCNKEKKPLFETNRKLFEGYVEEPFPTDIFYDSPIMTADVFIRCFDEILESKIKNLVLDITTFTREWMLIILAIAKLERYKKINIIIAYNYAASMSNDWLSMRPQQLRTVLGYPGKVLPSRKNHLILILGHEIERALAIIDEVEPAYITIVTGSREGSVTEAMCNRNTEFKNYVMSHYCNISEHKLINVRDFILAKDEIRKILCDKSSFNTIIAPLNTKISTLAAGVVALENEDIQICYMPMELYNSREFSTPSNEHVFFRLHS